MGMEAINALSAVDGTKNYRPKKELLPKKNYYQKRKGAGCPPPLSHWFVNSRLTEGQVDEFALLRRGSSPSCMQAQGTRDLVVQA